MEAQIEQQVEIINKLGLHARAAAKLVAVASKYHSNITISRETKSVNAKSIMSVLMLAAGRGTYLTLKAEGEDAQEAMQAVAQLITDKFEEGE